MLGHDDVDTGQAETVHTACYSALLHTAVTKKKGCLIFQTVAAIATKQRGVGVHISYIHYHLSEW